MENYSNYLKPSLEQRITKLEQLQKALQEEVEQLQAQKFMHVDKIEYKFDQLKVERLEGALHIGVSPQSSGQIEDLMWNENTEQNVSVHGSPVKNENDDVRKRVKDYIDQELPEKIEYYNKQYQCVLGEFYMKQMVEDLYCQMNERIQYYRNRIDQKKPKDKLANVESEIFDHIKKDIQQALIQHYEQLKMKRE